MGILHAKWFLMAICYYCMTILFNSSLNSTCFRTFCPWRIDARHAGCSFVDWVAAMRGICGFVMTAGLCRNHYVELSGCAIYEHGGTRNVVPPSLCVTVWRLVPYCSFSSAPLRIMLVAPMVKRVPSSMTRRSRSPSISLCTNVPVLLGHGQKVRKHVLFNDELHKIVMQ